jgi:hypothetical protein
VDNAWIADRLEAFAALLDLGDANPYMPRAYARAADTIRSAPVPVAGLVRSGRVRELHGIGPGIEARLRELVETGEIAELAQLERELSPELVGLGRYLGLGATRSLEIARALGVRCEVGWLALRRRRRGAVPDRRGRRRERLQADRVCGADVGDRRSEHGPILRRGGLGA